MQGIDFEQLAGEILRGLRGHRSQVAFSRRLKYKSNVSYLWESGRNWPTAAVFLWAATRVGVDVDRVVREFFPRGAEWLEETDLCAASGVARVLDDLRGATPIQELARRTGRSRYAVSRWLKGETEPRLPDFLRMIEATSQRLVDFVGGFLDVQTLPVLASRARELAAARELVAKIPWSPAVLLAMQTEAYLELPAHEPGWLSGRLGLPLEVEFECVELLCASGQVLVEGRGEAVRMRVARVQSIDMRADPQAGKRLKQWWASVGLKHMENDKPGLFSYNVFSVSQSDYERLQEMHRSYYRALRAVVAASEPEQRVVVANVQLFALDSSS
jgi:transcriptional regulator with XRE-family HTH domain